MGRMRVILRDAIGLHDSPEGVKQAWEHPRRFQPPCVHCGKPGMPHACNALGRGSASASNEGPAWTSGGEEPTIGDS